jgi:hypothetical protein
MHTAEKAFLRQALCTRLPTCLVDFLDFLAAAGKLKLFFALVDMVAAVGEVAESWFVCEVGAH